MHATNTSQQLCTSYQTPRRPPLLRPPRNAPHAHATPRPTTWLSRPTRRAHPPPPHPHGPLHVPSTLPRPAPGHAIRPPLQHATHGTTKHASHGRPGPAAGAAGPGRGGRCRPGAQQLWGFPGYARVGTTRRAVNGERNRVV